MTVRSQGLAAFPELDAEAMVERLHLALAGDVASASPQPAERARPTVSRSASDALSPPVSSLPVSGSFSRSLSQVVSRALSGWLHGRGVWGSARTLGLATAAATLLLVVASLKWGESWTGGGEGPDGGVRSKGGLSLRLYVKRGERVSEAASGERFHAGDRVRFEVELPRGGHFMLVGVEVKGTVYAAHPLGKQRSIAVGTTAEGTPPGRTPRVGQVSGTMALDESRGREWWHAVLCPLPFSLAEVRPAAEAGRLQLPAADCVSTPFLLLKVE
jgi:hypothetical protein